MKTVNLLIQKTHVHLRKRNIIETTANHIIIKLFKASDKQKILKAAREGENIFYTEKQR